MNPSTLSSEELVLRFLRARRLKRVSLVHTIEVECAKHWRDRGVYRAASSYRRAFQRVLAEGLLGRVNITTVSGGSPGRFSYREFHLERRVVKTKITNPIPHGNGYDVASSAAHVAAGT
ncbi:MAG: hypothetical protein GY835_05600 [bacterium]|nr:hypothetical protein [bacterium]